MEESLHPVIIMGLIYHYLPALYWNSLNEIDLFLGKNTLK